MIEAAQKSQSTDNFGKQDDNDDDDGGAPNLQIGTHAFFIATRAAKKLIQFKNRYFQEKQDREMNE